MRKRGLLRGITKLFDTVGFAVRLLRYDLLTGSRDGLVKIGPGVSATGDVSVRLGPRVFLGRNGIFQGAGEICIAAGTYVGNYFDFNCHARISIAENCMFGNFVTLVDNNHGTSPGIDMKDQPFELSPITIERNCWLGEKATVLAGVTIRENAIVAAGAVVTRDVPANAVVAGVPARVVRVRPESAAS
jgi:acetyltransferase-like isoleucine patch superfamily enzyme